MNVPVFGALLAWLAILESQRTPLLNRARDAFKPFHVGGLGRERPERNNLICIVKRVAFLVVEFSRQLSERHLQWFVKRRPAVLLHGFVRDQQCEHFSLSDGRYSRKLLHLARVKISVPLTIVFDWQIPMYPHPFHVSLDRLLGNVELASKPSRVRIPLRRNQLMNRQQPLGRIPTYSR